MRPLRALNALILKTFDDHIGHIATHGILPAIGGKNCQNEFSHDRKDQRGEAANSKDGQASCKDAFL